MLDKIIEALTIMGDLSLRILGISVLIMLMTETLLGSILLFGLFVSIILNL